MKILAFVKEKTKKLVAPVGKVVAPVAAGITVFFASSVPASAAIDFSTVSTDIIAATADVVAGGLILLGAYAGFWGIRKVISLFANG